MKKTFKVGIIGCGRMASILEDDPLRGKPATHAGAFSSHPGAKIVSGCDINPKRLKAFGKRWGVKKLYNDYRAMLEREKLDIVSVAAWTELHAKMVVDAAESGVKGIYCEKPMAVNLTQAKRMMRACKKNNVAMVVGHERRWDGSYRVIHDMLNAGELGKLRSITGYMLTGKPPKLSRRKYGGGPMFHDGTHLIDLFLYFGGAAEYVVGLEDRQFGDKFVEHTALGMIRFENGANGLILSGGERRYFHFELDIQTDSARAILGNHTSELYMAGKSKRYTGFTELEKVPFPAVAEGKNSLVGGIDDLVEQMNSGRVPVSSAIDGYKALEVILALYKSAGNGRAPVKLPL